MTDASATFWLSLIALASLTQAALLVTGVVLLTRRARRLEAQAETLQRDMLAPLAARANHLMDELEGVLHRIQGLDDDVRRSVDRAGQRVHAVTHAVRHHAIPVIGLIQATRAAFKVLTKGVRRHHRTSNTPGGTTHARH